MFSGREDRKKTCEWRNVTVSYSERMELLAGTGPYAPCSPMSKCLNGVNRNFSCLYTTAYSYIMQLDISIFDT
jgi:hypothetical protein